MIGAAGGVYSARRSLLGGSPSTNPAARIVRGFAAGAFSLVIIGSALISGQRPALAASHSQVNGSGSTWAYNAVNAWIGSVAGNGLRVTFNGNGSAAGRRDFAGYVSDFAVSDIGYQGTDPLTGNADTSNRPYAYVPLVAGGTAFPYNITQAGQKVTNLRLSGQTLAKIFTNQITNWSDPAITADNNGHQLPSLKIVPVVHSEGSGTTYQFSAYLVHDYPDIWASFAGAAKPTEYWPNPKPGQIPQNGSDQVMNYIASSSGNGTIGFDEYSYALAKSIPVAKVENANHYYTLPTQYNVAVALTQAIINSDTSSPNYLLEDLSNVYNYGDNRAYPLSSYSYGVIPTDASDKGMTSGKRQTIADYLYYSICQGQAAVGSIGYSALPLNLVQGGFSQIGLLNKADPNVDLTNENVTTCGNPTFVAGNLNENHLADIAQQPPSCDMQGQGPCGTSNDTTGNNGGSTTSASSSASASHSASAGSSASASAGTKGSTPTAGSTQRAGGASSTAGAPAPGSTAGAGDTQGTGSAPPGGAAENPTSAPSIDPVTGQLTGGDGTDGNSNSNSDGNSNNSNSGDSNTNASYVQATNLSAGQGTSAGLAALAALFLVACVVAPPVLARRWQSRRGGGV